MLTKQMPMIIRPLCAVLYNTNPDVVQMLLDLGADASMRSDADLTAFDYAAYNPNITDTDVYWLLYEAQF